MPSDRDVFSSLRVRLVSDVGYLISLIEEKRLINENAPIPFWALLRTLFPIAESIGFLVHNSDKSVNNLTLIFSNNLVKYNDGYQKLANTLVIMYRHALMHTDIVRIIQYDDVQVGWVVDFDEGNKHLRIFPSNTGFKNRNNGSTGVLKFFIWFDIKQFYDDLLSLCRDLEESGVGGQAKERYNSWQIYFLDERQKVDQKAKTEIREMLESMV